MEQQLGTINLGGILRELEAEIAEAEQREREAALVLADLRGQRRGVILVFERSQQPPSLPHVGPPSPPVFSQGEAPAE